MDPPAAGARRQAEQWMRVAEKLLMAKDLEGCKEFSSQALAADPRTPGAEDLHAAADVLLAAQRRRMPNGKPDPYAVLGIDPSNPASRHPDVVHSSYRRLSLLLNRSHPDRPSSVSVGEAARLVADAWAFLSNSGFKSALDTELDAAAAALAYRAPAPMQQHQPQPSPSPQQIPTGAAPQPRPSPQQSPIPAAHQPRLPPQPNPLRATPQPPARAAAPPQLPRQSPIWAAPQLRPPPQQSPVPAAPQPTPPPQQSPIPAARQPTPPPQQSLIPAARQPLPPTQQSPILAAQQPPPPPPQQSPIPAARQPPPPPQQSPIPAARQPPPPPQQSPILAAHQPPQPTQQSPLREALEPPSEAAVPPVESGTPPSSTFWTICKVCSHIHQYDRIYEARKLKCSSCHLPFVAEAMTETPPIVPGTDMYYCTWGFFPIGFPGCPGFESLVTKQPQGPDQLNAPWLGANGVAEANGGAGVQNGTPFSASVELPVVLEPLPEPLMRMRVLPAAPEPAIPMRVEVPAGPEPVIPTRVEVPVAPKPVKTMRLNAVKVGAKKRGRPKGSKNKKKIMT